MHIERIIIPVFLLLAGFFCVFRVPAIVARGIQEGRIGSEKANVVRWIRIVGYFDLLCGGLLLLAALFGWGG